MNYKKLQRELKGGEWGEIDLLDSTFVEQGHVYFAATGSLKVPRTTSNDWGYRLTLGFGLGLTKGLDKVTSHVYGRVEGYGGLDVDTKTNLSKLMPSETAALSAVSKTIGKLKTKVLAEKNLSAPARKAFKQLKAPKSN